MGKAETLSDVEPKAVMTDAEIAAWDALPAAVQLERMRAAIDKGMDGPAAPLDMGGVWREALARQRNANR
jgi:hypothetical protein